MLALMAVGVEPGDQVITNGFTFTALLVGDHARAHGCRGGARRPGHHERVYLYRLTRRRSCSRSWLSGWSPATRSSRTGLPLPPYSSAIMLALMAVGVEPGDQVITNGFTFTALPSTIMRLGAEPVLVEATKSWIMDLDDLEKKIAAFP